MDAVTTDLQKDHARVDFQASTDDDMPPNLRSPRETSEAILVDPDGDTRTSWALRAYFLLALFTQF